MNFGKRYAYLQQAGDGTGEGGGGGGEPQFTVEGARQFLTPFVPDPKALEALPEDQLRGHYTKARGHHDKVLKEATDKAVERARQEAGAGWQEKWRETYSGNDTKRLERLKRYTTPNAALDALLGLQDKVAAGELRSSLPKNASPEALASWRKENGLPEQPEGYLAGLKLPKGMEKLPEHREEGIKEYLKVAHAEGYTPQQVSAGVGWFLERERQQEEAQKETDAEFKQTSEDALRKDWGTDYRRNLNAVHAMLDLGGEEVRDSILDARTPDGKPLASNPAVLKFLADRSLELNPNMTVVPGEGGNVLNSIEDEMAKLTKLMGDHGSEYWKGPNAARHQQRYRDLVEAKQRAGRKAA